MAAAARLLVRKPIEALAVEKDAAISSHHCRGNRPGAIGSDPCERPLFEVLGRRLHQLAHVTGYRRAPNSTGSRKVFCVAAAGLGLLCHRPTGR